MFHFWRIVKIFCHSNISCTIFQKMYYFIQQDLYLVWLIASCNYYAVLPTGLLSVSVFTHLALHNSPPLHRQEGSCFLLDTFDNERETRASSSVPILVPSLAEEWNMRQPRSLLSAPWPVAFVYAPWWQTHFEMSLYNTSVVCVCWGCGHSLASDCKESSQPTLLFSFGWKIYTFASYDDSLMSF